MASSINTNISSINAQRNLTLSGASLSTTMQRLSSGLRVNSAKDDAAGLAISERMGTQVKGLAVAGRNANDGISLAQTAEGALSKVGDMLQRMRELAVQAGNATNSQSDRQALQAEVKQLSAEIDRVAKQTNFNGQKLLNGSFAGAVFQVGANSGENITLSGLGDTRASQLSTVSYASYNRTLNLSDDPTPAITRFNEPIDAGALVIEIKSTPTLSVPLPRIEAATSSQQRLGQVVEAINNKSADTGVTAYLTKQVDDTYSVEIMSGKANEGQPIDFDFVGFSYQTSGIELPPKSHDWRLRNPIWNSAPNVENAPVAQNQQIFEDALSNFMEIPVVAATLKSDLTDFKQQWIDRFNAYESNKTAANAQEFWQISAKILYQYDNMMAAKDIFDQKNPKNVSDANDYLYSLRFFKAGDHSIFVPNYTNMEDAMAEINSLDPAIFPLGVVDKISNEKSIENIDISTQSGAWVALKKIDSAIDQVSSARATLGAMQSRFENTVSNIEIQAENLSAARGRIVDADFAKETANLSRTQILQQAGTAMVAQANQIPQSVLQLLKS